MIVTATTFNPAHMESSSDIKYLDNRELVEQLIETIKLADSEYYDKGLKQVTHQNLKDLMHEFDMRLTFSKI